MKKLLIFILHISVLSMLTAQTSSYNFLFFGENRAALPGPDIANTFFSDNPADAAYSSFNSINAGFIFTPQNDEFLVHPGIHYALSISNMRLINTVNESLVNEYGVEEYRKLDLLSFQLAFSLKDIGISLPFNTAFGVQINREKEERWQNINGVQTLDEEILDMDAGIDFRIGKNRLGVIVKRMLNFTDSTHFLSPLEIIVTADLYTFQELIAHIGGSYVNGYGESDFTIKLGLSRGFFSNSLSTGFLIDAYVDTDNENLIPYYQYGMTLNYMFNTRDGLFPLEPGTIIDSIFSGMFINVRACAQVSNAVDMEFVVPMFAITLGKTF